MIKTKLNNEAYHIEKIRVLIADDHAVVRKGTRRILEHESDLEVVAEAADGEEAILTLIVV